MGAEVTAVTGSASRLIGVMLAIELDRLATSSDRNAGHRLRVIMRMVDRTTPPPAATPPEQPRIGQGV